VAFPGTKNRCLELKDSDPYDYTRAVRVFEESKQTGITFKVFARDIQNGRLELEVLDHSGHRPIRVIFGEDGHIRFSNGNDLTDGGRYEADTWYQIKINVNVAKGKYDLLMDNRMIVNQAIFAESVSSIERISLRTGAYRTEPTRQTDRYAGGDLPNPGDPILPVVYYIDDIIIK
jgi:hypothetical protein